MVQQNNTKLFLTTELASACFTHEMMTAQRIELMNKPQQFIRENTGVEINPCVSMQVRINNIKEVHLPLPYYSNMDSPSAQALEDDDLENIVGGEIIAVLIATIGAAGIAGAVAGGALAGTAGATTVGIVAAAAVGGAVGTAVGVGGTIAMGLHVKDEIEKQKAAGTYEGPK